MKGIFLLTIAQARRSGFRAYLWPVVIHLSFLTRLLNAAQSGVYGGGHDQIRTLRSA